MTKLKEFVERKLQEYKATKDTNIYDTSSVDFFMKNWKMRNIEGQFKRLLHSLEQVIDIKHEDKKSEYFGDLYNENANISATITKEEMFDNIQEIVDKASADLSNEDDEKLLEENSKRTLKNFNSKKEIIQALFFEEQIDLKDSRIDEIMADSLYVDKAKPLDAKEKYFGGVDDKKIIYNLKQMYEKLTKNYRDALMLDPKMLAEHGLTKHDFIDAYRTAAANLLKSQIYQKNEQEFKDLVEFVKNPLAVIQSKYPEIADEEKMKELGIKNLRDHKTSGAEYLNILEFDIKEISGVDQEQKEVAGTTEAQEETTEEVADLESSVIYDVDEIIEAEEMAPKPKQVAVDISTNEVLNEKFKEFNKKFGLNINYEKMFNVLDNNFNGKNIDSIKIVHNDTIKDMFNAMLKDSEVAQGDVVKFGKEFKSLVETLFEEKGGFDELENLATAGIPVDEYNDLVKNNIEKYKPISINQYYVHRFKSIDDNEMSNLAYYARTDVKDMLNPVYRNAVAGSRGFGYKDDDVYKESAAILKALIQIHEERPSNYWWRHPIRNYRENAAIKSIRQQILAAGCQEDTLNAHLNSKEIEEESYLQAKADFEVFKGDLVRQKFEFDQSQFEEEVEQQQMINNITNELNKSKNVSLDDLV